MSHTVPRKAAPVYGGYEWASSEGSSTKVTYKYQDSVQGLASSTAFTFFNTDASFVDSDGTETVLIDASAGTIAATGGIAARTPVSTVTGDGATTVTLTVAQSGTTFFLNSTGVGAIVLPAVSTAAGVEYRFIAKNTTADCTITTGNTHENIVYGSVVLGVTGADDTAQEIPASAEDTITVDTTAVIGDWLRLCSDGTNWYVSGYTATAAGIAFSTT